MKNKPIYILVLIACLAMLLITGQSKALASGCIGGANKTITGVKENSCSYLKDLSDEELQKIKRAFTEARITEVRRQNPSKTPTIAREKLEAVKNACVRQAQEFYNKTSLWYYVEGPKWDEWSTAMTYNILKVFFYGSVKDLPNYSPENQKKAIEFWQSWQNKDTGNFYNPFFVDPQNPSIKRTPPEGRPQESTTNHKYIVSILENLGAEPFYPYQRNAQLDEKGMIDIAEFWKDFRANHTSHPPGICVDMAKEIEKGKLEYLPHVEAGLAALVRKINPATGTIYPDKRHFTNYYTHVHIFKFQRYILWWLGLENIPRSAIENLIAGLVANEHDWTNSPDVLNNTTDMMVNMLWYTDDHQNDILNALQRQAKAYTYELRPVNYGYTLSLRFLALYLNWQEYPLSDWIENVKRDSPVYGADLKYRYVVGPYGNWVNVIKKRPQEILGHPGYSYEKYGMKPRNKLHWQKKIVELVPMQAVSLEKDSATNETQGTLVFTLTKEQLADVDDIYFQARWNGRFELDINGVPAKTIWYAFNEPDQKAGLAIYPDARKALKVGQNVITIKQVGKSAGMIDNEPDLSTFIEIGLISWSP